MEQFERREWVASIRKKDTGHECILWNKKQYIYLPIFFHPEIGWVAEDQGGAQSKGCMWDQGQQPGVVLQRVLDWRPLDHRVALPTMPLLDAALASDGWWWRVVRHYEYNLPDEYEAPRLAGPDSEEERLLDWENSQD